MAALSPSLIDSTATPESTTTLLHLHAVSLVGANGKQDHAVAVINRMIFDSSTMNAMLLCLEALDWCCNCNGGCGKTGQTMRITMKRCQFEATKSRTKSKEM